MAIRGDRGDDSVHLQREHRDDRRHVIGNSEYDDVNFFDHEPVDDDNDNDDDDDRARFRFARSVPNDDCEEASSRRGPSTRQ